jgi:hypothetical protein
MDSLIQLSLNEEKQRNLWKKQLDGERKKKGKTNTSNKNNAKIDQLKESIVDSDERLSQISRFIETLIL